MAAAARINGAYPLARLKIDFAIAKIVQGSRASF